MNIVIKFLATFILSFVLTLLFEVIARRLKILDYPDSGKIHDRPVPLLGGAAIFLSFMIVILFIQRELKFEYKILFMMGAVIFLVGLLDDIKPIPAVKRLFIQIVASIVLVCGGISFTFLPNTIAGRAGEILLTLFWMVGLINAFNYLDGLDGLLTGVSIISIAFFFVFSYLSGQFVLANVLVIFAGACAGFFPRNFFGGRIFMGSAGSAWMGFILAGLAIIGDWAGDNPVDLIIPLLIFGVPIFDMITTTVCRLLEKKARSIVELLEYKGRDHFHYKLYRIGLGKRGAVFFIYLVSILLGLMAMLLSLSQDPASAAIVLCVCTLFFAIISLLLAAPSQMQ